MNFEEDKFIPEPKLTWTEDERKLLIQELDAIRSLRPRCTRRKKLKEYLYASDK